MASLAWLAYVPLPGLAWVAALLDKHDRFTRYHARQGGMLVGLIYVGLILFGLLARASSASVFQAIIGALSLVWLLAGAAGVGLGIVGAVTGRYVRVRGPWDVLALLRR